MNDLCNFSPIPETLMFADDTALYFEGASVNSETINACLSRLSEWMVSNRMSLNAAKTKFMLFDNGRNAHTALTITIGNNAIEQVQSYKYLGCVLDSKINFKEHSKEVVAKVNRINGVMFANRSILPIRLCITLVQALILPVIAYCDTAYHKSAQHCLHPIEVAYKRSLRTAYRLPANFPTNLLYARTIFFPLTLCRQISCSKLAIKLLNNVCAEFLKNLIEWVDYDIVRRRLPRAAAPQQSIFVVPRFRLQSSEQMISHWAPKTLNLIPRITLERASLTTNPARNLAEKLKIFFRESFDLQLWTRQHENENQFVAIT
jgi:hypothetical protein